MTTPPPETADPAPVGQLSAGLLAVLDDPGPDVPAPAGPPAVEQLFLADVDPRGSGSGVGRLAGTGGVRFSHAATYWLTVADLEPIAARRKALDGMHLVLVKFAFTFLEPPRGYTYAKIRIRIGLKPQVPVMQLRPRQENAQAQTTRSFSSEFAPTVTRLLQLSAKRTASRSTSRTEEQQVVTGQDLGSDGFGWVYEAADGLPLHHGVRYTTVVLEVPKGTAALVGMFDAEAVVTRRLLGVTERHRALPAVPAAPFDVDL